MISDLNLDDYNYSLENNRIAKYPKSKRDDSKLLVYKEGKLINNKSFLVKPDNFTIPYNSEKVHGISTKIALEKNVVEDICKEIIQKLKF